jgi:hypothetical protein
MFKRNRIGIIGIVIALLGVGVAVFQDDIRSHFDTAPVEVKDRVIQKGAELFGVKVESETTRDKVTFLQFGLGFVGIVLGVVSWIRKENHRVSSSAAALGIVAIAWEYVLIAAGFAVLALIVGSFS